MNRNHIKTDKICMCTAMPMQFAKAHTADATQLDSCIASASAVCIWRNRFKYMPMLPYTATTVLSQHLVPRDSESPAVPSKSHIWGGGGSKIFPSPSNSGRSFRHWLYGVSVRTRTHFDAFRDKMKRFRGDFLYF